MDHTNLIGHNGTVHEGLLNSHTGFLVDVACDAGRYAVVHHYEKLDPARVTDASLSCPECVAANSPATAHLHRGRMAHRYAEDVLALADSRACPPARDDEGLRLAFVALGTESPPPRALYALIREHVTDILTDRALAAIVLTVHERDRRPVTYSARELSRRYSKLDRAAPPSEGTTER